MPIQVREEDSRLFAKILIIFSVVQVVLAMVLFMYLNFGGASIVLAAAAILGIVLIRYFWDDKKTVRMVLRGAEYLIILLPFLIFIATLLSSLIEANGHLSSWEWTQDFHILCCFVQSFLLLMLPMMAATAVHGRRFDVVSMRVFSLAELALALFTCFYHYNLEPTITEFGVENIYFRAFFCLCVLVTAVSSFLVRPVDSSSKQTVNPPSI